MRKRDQDRYEAMLREKREQLVNQRVNDSKSSRQTGGDGAEDYIDYAVSSYAKEFLLSLSDLERKQLVLIEEALRRLGTREFGRCRNCEEPIERKRMNAAPWARHCIPCQELEERGMLDQDARDFGSEEE